MGWRCTAGRQESWEATRALLRKEVGKARLALHDKRVPPPVCVCHPACSIDFSLPNGLRSLRRMPLQCQITWRS